MQVLALAQVFAYGLTRAIEINMKKITIYVLVFCVQTALFAENPAAELGFSLNGSYTGGLGFSGTTVFFKVPQVPVFWKVDLMLNSIFYMNVNGDYYIIDKKIVPNIGLGLYFGAGAGIGITLNSNDIAFSLAGRLPVGLTWQPEHLQYKDSKDSFELFLEFVPSLGFLLYNEATWNYSLAGGVGIRIWIKQ